MSIFVVRNKNTKRFLRSASEYCTGPLRGAHHFVKVSAELEAGRYPTFREVRRKVWLVKWTDGIHCTYPKTRRTPEGWPYYNQKQRSAEKFDTIEAARAMRKQLPMVARGRWVIVCTTVAP